MFQSASVMIHVHQFTFILSTNFSECHFLSIPGINGVSDDLRVGGPAELATNAITCDDEEAKK